MSAYCAWRKLVCALVLLLGALASTAHALELRADTASYTPGSALLFLEDPTRRLTVDEVARKADSFRAVRLAAGDVNFGYSHSAYWLALPLKLARDAPSRWLLEFGYSSLDRVEVYTRGANGYARQVAGDLQPFAERPYPHRNLVFPISVEPGSTDTVYVRVTSEGNLTLPVKLWQADALHAHDETEYALLAVYYGMLFALLAYNLFLYIGTSDRVFLAYVFCASSMVVAMASQNGFGNQFLWPGSPAWGNAALPVGMSAAGFSAAIFTRLFLGTRGSFPNLDRLLRAFSALFAVSALSVLVSYQFSAVLTSIGGLAFAATATSAAVYCHAHGNPGARYFLTAWTLLLVGVATLALRNMGILPTTALTANAMQIGSAFEMLLLSFALADRINVMRRQHEIASTEALQAKQMLVEGLRRSEQALEQRVTERTQALERANQQLVEKEKELEYRAHHDPLTGLPNRDLLADRSTQALARARRSGGSVAALLIDLDNFKDVNDTYGHAAGDRLLATVANALRELVRETDTIARLGGDEFVIVLESLENLEAAERVAEKCVAAVKGASAEWTRAPVGASVGIACFPLHASEGDELIRRADTAMYAAKAAGRNRWCVTDSGDERVVRVASA